MKTVVLNVKVDADYSDDFIEVSLDDVLSEVEGNDLYEKALQTISEVNGADNTMQFLFPDYTVEDYKRAKLAGFNELIEPLLQKHFEDFKGNNYIEKGLDLSVTELTFREVETVPCHWCETVHVKGITVDLYDHPHTTEPETVHLCSYYCLDTIQGRNFSKDFNYIECDECGRLICEQSPKNGYMLQFQPNEFGEYVCNECHRKSVFQNGISEDYFDEGRIQSDWHDRSEIEEHGFTRYETYFVTNFEDLHKQVKPLFENNLVLIENDRIAIGGSEGTVTVWVKPKN